eukprot:CAMPEP_0179411206 /NCGR_PEP_ID=MMETSP0799-20121207/3773_1 /TAXON_ID=46947 /ORGANISM="Geminigera cryophila, Strain CCMP2564" /LENGTH=42 /DNA_ID= /DNA_START= /DNA_END= /DNA_ORIENTATION=
MTPSSHMGPSNGKGTSSSISKSATSLAADAKKSDSPAPVGTN